MLETMKGTSKVNSANKTIIFIDWLSNVNKRACKTDFSIVSSVKYADSFLSMLSRNVKVNTSGILISKIINNTVNINNDKRDNNRWLLNIKYLKPLIKFELSFQIN